MSRSPACVALEAFYVIEMTDTARHSSLELLLVVTAWYYNVWYTVCCSAHCVLLHVTIFIITPVLPSLLVHFHQEDAKQERFL